MKITEKYRPTKLSEVAVQKTAIRQIENAIERSGLAGSSWWIAGAMERNDGTPENPTPFLIRSNKFHGLLFE